MSNIAANSEEDATSIINNGLLINLVFAGREKNIEVKKEAIWVISNLCYIINDPATLDMIIKADVLTLIYEVIVYEAEYGQI